MRVMRTCRELGIATVAVYSELDRDAMHVRYADEAYALGGQTAAESYLNTEAILDAIERSGAEAVHPGYGFFSENADFARTITERGRDLDRPAARGDRRSWATRSPRGRPPPPPTSRRCPAPSTPSRTRRRSIAFGDEFGWPVAIKAAYGGGGEGLKVARSAEEAAAAFESASREARRLLRAGRVLHGALPHPSSPHRAAGLRRHPRQRRVAGRARLLDPAAPPEADRGESGRRPDRRGPRRDGRGRGQGRRVRAAT